MKFSFHSISAPAQLNIKMGKQSHVDGCHFKFIIINLKRALPAAQKSDDITLMCSLSHFPRPLFHSCISFLHPPLPPSPPTVCCCPCFLYCWGNGSCQRIPISLTLHTYLPSYICAYIFCILSCPWEWTSHIPTKAIPFAWVLGPTSLRNTSPAILHFFPFIFLSCFQVSPLEHIISNSTQTTAIYHCFKKKFPGPTPSFTFHSIGFLPFIIKGYIYIYI